jgi:hypothetical protein
MAGYYNFSMSNNAVDAYDRGLIPASKIKGIPAELIKEYCASEEWHHSSKEYNRVDFYDPRKVRCTFGLLTDDDIQSLKEDGYDDEDLEPNHLAVEALEYYKKNKKSETIYENCTVYWINWPSFSSKHKKPQHMREDNCRVVVKGQTATVFLKDGILKKRLSTNGFMIYDKHERI